LGALLDLTAEVLATLPTVQLGELPRMADFACILEALNRIRRLRYRPASKVVWRSHINSPHGPPTSPGLSPSTGVNLGEPALTS
jgi:hypothetical protein